MPSYLQEDPLGHMLHTIQHGVPTKHMYIAIPQNVTGDQLEE
jgi:hypothetical protein